MNDEELLRPAVREDGPSWHRWRNEGREAFVDGLSFSIESHLRWFEAKLADPRVRLWTVLQDGRPAGMLGLSEIDHRQQSAEIGWVYIEPAARGLGSAAVREAVQLGFRELNLYRIYLTVLACNTRAIRCYEKVGFRHEGRLRDAIYKGGQRHDLLLMALLRPEFEAEIGDRQCVASAPLEISALAGTMERVPLS